MTTDERDEFWRDMQATLRVVSRRMTIAFAEQLIWRRALLDCAEEGIATDRVVELRSLARARGYVVSKRTTAGPVPTDQQIYLFEANDTLGRYHDEED